MRPGCPGTEPNSWASGRLLRAGAVGAVSIEQARVEEDRSRRTPKVEMTARQLLPRRRQIGGGGGAGGAGCLRIWGERRVQGSRGGCYELGAVGEARGSSGIAVVGGGRVRGQAIADDGEGPLRRSWLGAVALHRLAADQQRLDVLDPDVGPDGASRGRLGQEQLEQDHGVPLDVGDGGGDVEPDPGERLLQALVGFSLLDEHVQVGEERLARLLGLSDGGGTVAEAIQPVDVIAPKRASLVGKCRYTVPAPTPARRAISSIGTDRPPSANAS